MKWLASLGGRSLSLLSIDFVNDKGCRRVFIKVTSSLLEAELDLQNQSIQRQRGDLLPPSSGRCSASTWNQHNLIGTAVMRPVCDPHPNLTSCFSKETGPAKPPSSNTAEGECCMPEHPGESSCFKKEYRVVCMLHLALVFARLVSEGDFSGTRWMTSQQRCCLTFPLC